MIRFTLLVFATIAASALPASAQVCSAYHLLEHGNQTGYESVPGCYDEHDCPPSDIVIDNMAAYTSFWMSNTSNIVACQPDGCEPEERVDFNTYLVVATMMGFFSNTGHGTVIECVEYVEDAPHHLKAVIHVKDQHAGSDCYVHPAFVHPFHIIQISKMGQATMNVEFDHDVETIQCQECCEEACIPASGSCIDCCPQYCPPACDPCPIGYTGCL